MPHGMGELSPWARRQPLAPAGNRSVWTTREVFFFFHCSWFQDVSFQPLLLTFGRHCCHPRPPQLGSAVWGAGPVPRLPILAESVSQRGGQSGGRLGGHTAVPTQDSSPPMDGVESSLVSLSDYVLTGVCSGVHHFRGTFFHVCIRFSHYASVYVARLF